MNSPRCTLEAYTEICLDLGAEITGRRKDIGSTCSFTMVYMTDPSRPFDFRDAVAFITAIKNKMVEKGYAVIIPEGDANVAMDRDGEKTLERCHASRALKIFFIHPDSDLEEKALKADIGDCVLSIDLKTINENFMFGSIEGPSSSPHYR